MSNIFGKHLLKDLFSDSANESQLNLPKYVTIIDKKLNKNISSTFSPAQKGGAMSINSASKENTEADVNQLISMLTSESSESNNSTETAALENRLKKIKN